MIIARDHYNIVKDITLVHKNEAAITYEVNTDLYKFSYGRNSIKKPVKSVLLYKTVERCSDIFSKALITSAFASSDEKSNNLAN